jgi:hypothetical protein
MPATLLSDTFPKLQPCNLDPICHDASYFTGGSNYKCVNISGRLSSGLHINTEIARSKLWQFGKEEKLNGKIQRYDKDPETNFP